PNVHPEHEDGAPGELLQVPGESLHQWATVIGSVVDGDGVGGGFRPQARVRELGSHGSLTLVVRTEPEEGGPPCVAQCVVCRALRDLRQPGRRINRTGGAARAAVLVTDDRDHRWI